MNATQKDELITMVLKCIKDWCETASGQVKKDSKTDALKSLDSVLRYINNI
jgi:hypothetical protein